MATEGKNLSDYTQQNLPDARDMRIGLVVSAWNEQITEGMYSGAYQALVQNGVQESNIKRVNVPGTFELTYGAKLLCESGAYDAVVVIGCVIQGETRHFDFVCQGVTQGIAHLNATQKTPVIFCVLTDNHVQQSIDRSGGKHGNKGVEAAITAIHMAALRV
jgi:6,7-dimethyl-8-ribityllumazine synthase